MNRAFVALAIGGLLIACGGNNLPYLAPPVPPTAAPAPFVPQPPPPPEPPPPAPEEPLPPAPPPVPPPPIIAPAGCAAASAASQDGTLFFDCRGMPNGYRYLLAEADNRIKSGSIASSARGSTVFFSSLTSGASARASLFAAGGLDGSGAYYTARVQNNPQLSSSSTAGLSIQTYDAMSPLLPAAVFDYKLTSSTAQAFASADVVSAYNAGRTITSHKAIISVTGYYGSYKYFHQIAKSLQGTSNFAAPRYFGDIAANIVGVLPVGGSDTASWRWYRKQPGHLGFSMLHGNSRYPFNSTAAHVQYRDENNKLVVDGDYIQISEYLTDLLVLTTTARLRTLLSKGNNSGATNNLTAAFPTADCRLVMASNLCSAGLTRANFAGQKTIYWTVGTNTETRLLNLLAAVALQSRTGQLYSVTQLNEAGTDLRYNTPCGIAREGCFVLPFYDPSPDTADTDQDYAAARFTAFLDTVWTLWPALTNETLHTLMKSCTQDLGTTGVDYKFGQGLLDFACVVNPQGGFRLPAGVQGVSGALYGASTAGTALIAYDAYGRDFEHQVLHRNLQAKPAFDPAHNALVHNVGGFLELTANEQITSAWLTNKVAGNLRLGLGATYEGDSLFGMTGSGHFAIADGRSVGMRLQWGRNLSNFWNMRLSLAHYKGTASAAYPGAVSDLALEQSNANITFERRFSDKAYASFKAACSSGNSGSFNSFGTHIELFGADNCSHSIGAQIRW